MADFGLPRSRWQVGWTILDHSGLKALAVRVDDISGESRKVVSDEP